jgi:hypothetical protein
MSYRVSSSQNQAARLLEGLALHACRDRERRDRLVRHVVAGRCRQRNRSADRPHHQDPAKRRAHAAPGGSDFGIVGAEHSCGNDNGTPTDTECSAASAGAAGVTRCALRSAIGNSDPSHFTTSDGAEVERAQEGGRARVPRSGQTDHHERRNRRRDSVLGVAAA